MTRAIPILLVALALGVPVPVPADTLPVAADAYLRMETPTSNHGQNPSLVLRNRFGAGSETNFGCYPILQFQLSDIDYADTVDAATLYVYYASQSGEDPSGRTISCHRVTGPWTEYDVTWNGRPSFVDVPTSVAVVPETTGAWIGFDVTADLQTLTDPYGNYGWVLSDTTRWGAINIPTMIFRSREHGSEFAPRLEVEVTPGSGYTISLEPDTLFPRWEEWDWGLAEGDISLGGATPFVGEPVSVTATVRNLALCQARAAHGWYSPLGRSCWGEWDFATGRAETLDITFRCRDNWDVDWRAELDGMHLTTLTVPSVGDTNTWNLVTIRDVPVGAGRHRILLGTYQMDYDPDYFLDWIDIGTMRIEAERFDRTGGNDPEPDRRGLTIQPRACDPPDSSRVTVQIWEGDPTDGGTMLVEGFVGPTNMVADVDDDYAGNYYSAHYIPSNDSADLTCLWTPAETDTHELWVVVDPHSRLDEINEDNNTARLRVVARTRDHALSPWIPNPAGSELDHGAGGTSVDPGTIAQITYSIPDDTDVNLTLYNAAGRLVKTLVSGERDAGSHTVFWDGTSREGERMGSGVYFTRFTAGDFVATRKLVVLR